MDSLKLINEVNMYLDALPKHKDLMSNSDEVVSKVKEYKATMEQKGFISPLGKIRVNYEGLSAEDKREIKKQLRMMRYLTYIKKITLARTKLSLSSIIVGKRLMAALNLPVDSEELTYLPFDGNLFGYVGRFGIVSSTVYSRVKSFLALEHLPELYQVKIEYNDERDKGNVKQDRLTLIRVDRSLEKRLKEAYGDSCKVVSIEPLKKPLIHNGYVRAAVSCYYSLRTCEKKFQSLCEKHVTDRIREYRSLLSEIDFDEWTSLRLIQEHPELTEKLIESRFIQKNINSLPTIDSEHEFSYNTEFKDELFSYRRRVIDGLFNHARKTILSQLYAYYMTATKTYREKNSIFPTLVVEPNELQLSIFDELDWTSKDVLSEKFNLEKKVRDNRYLGPALYTIRLNKDAYTVARRFNLSVDKLKENIKIVSALIGGRGREFLERLGSR